MKFNLTDMTIRHLNGTPLTKIIIKDTSGNPVSHTPQQLIAHYLYGVSVDEKIGDEVAQKIYDGNEFELDEKQIDSIKQHVNNAPQQVIPGFVKRSFNRYIDLTSKNQII